VAEVNGPLIWALTGRNAGDNAQARALATDVAAATCGAVVEIPLRFNLLREIPNGWLGASLASLSAPLPTPPWPDMVIGVGRRAVPVARWIKAQSGAHLVWLGRPRADTARFDLLLTTPQYGVPDSPTTTRLSLPYGPPIVAAKPITPVMVLGGNSWANRLTGQTIENLAACLESADMVEALRITTSPRTSVAFMDAVAARFPFAEFHRFGKGANPYRQWLTEASACIVTGDSVSLIADAVATGVPTFVATPEDARFMGALRKAAPSLAQNWLTHSGNRAFLAPPPYPAAVIIHLKKTGVAEIKDGFAKIIGAKPMVAAEHADALARVIALLR
jgi:mitochondrial fission protein ELM1